MKQSGLFSCADRFIVLFESYDLVSPMKHRSIDHSFERYLLFTDPLLCSYGQVIYCSRFLKQKEKKAAAAATLNVD